MRVAIKGGMRITKAERRQRLMNRLADLGFSYDEANKLRRIEMTLHRWSEEECNGTIQRDGDEGDGKPRRYYERQNGEIVRGSIIPDREAGALRRLKAILQFHSDLSYYHQGDPRGCALYIVRNSDIVDGDISSLYTRGVAVCD